MTPSTIVRRPRGPFTFIGLSSFFLDKDERPEPQPKRRRSHRCVALQDDGSECGLTARYISMDRGGYVCDEHRTDLKKEVVAV